jgi:molybdate transport system ATP-binding protein
LVERKETAAGLVQIQPSRFVANSNPRDVQHAPAIPMPNVTHSVAEAVALGSRLFLMERGKVVADGPPPDTLAAARRSDDGSIPFEGVLNVFAARLEDHATSDNATRLHPDDGPGLIVGSLDRPAGRAAGRPVDPRASAPLTPISPPS